MATTQSGSGILKPINRKRKIEVPSNRKPRILLISDVKGWAWWNKSKFLIKYLSDEFDFEITCALEHNKAQSPIKKGKYDLYFTYGYSYVHEPINRGIPQYRIATGVTAHRSPNIIFPQMNRAGHLHANSILLKQELEVMGFKNVHYVPNGVDETLFKVVDPIPQYRSNIIVGHVGKACKEKGQEQFIKPAITTAGALSLYNFSNYMQKRPLEEMYKIYNQMDVFIVASAEDGTPNPALEAAACGRPIISNMIGNMPEFIEHGKNGFLIPKRNIREYAYYIDLLRKDRELLQTMGNNARKTVEKEWTWEKQSEYYRTMFRSIFGRE